MTDRASVLRAALQRRQALVVPGCHDTLSARIIESCGFAATQVSGFGVAGSLLARPDVGLVDMKDILDITGHIARAVEIPVMADIDTGGGNAINASRITEHLIEMGVAGVNIEDQVFPKRCGHMEGKQVIPAEEMAGKGPGDGRRPRASRPRHRYQRAHRRLRVFRTERSDLPRQPLSRSPGRTWRSSTASARAPTSFAPWRGFRGCFP